MGKPRQDNFCIILPKMDLSDRRISPFDENVALRSGSYLWLLLLVPFFSTASFAQSDRYNVIQLETRPEVSSMVRGLNNSALVVGRFGTEFNTGTRGFIWNGGNQIEQLDSLPSGDFSEAVSVNELGDVVGSSNTKSHLRALLWTKDGEMRDLGTSPGDSGARATAINRSGQVVGWSFGPHGTSAFLWTKKDGMQSLTPLAGSDFSQATSINNRGVIAGTSGFAHGDHRAVVWENAAVIKDLGVLPGDSGSESYAINNSGQVVGASSGPSGIHAFIWTDRDGMRSLGSLPGGEAFSMALGINNSGQVVGLASRSTVESHAFISTSRSGMRDLNDLIPADLQILLVAAVGINDRGQIIAYGGNRDTFEHDTPSSVYLLTPKGK